MTALEILRAIEAGDPDGGETEPTDVDYTRFRTWVRQAYGETALRDYLAGGWEPQPEV